MMEAKYILVFVLSSLFMLTLYGLSKHAEKVHASLYEFGDLARRAGTVEDLCQAERNLRKYAQKHCYHRHLASHAREILDYIQGRKQKMQRQ